jgi:hypothetical protein
MAYDRNLDFTSSLNFNSGMSAPKTNNQWAMGGFNNQPNDAMGGLDTNFGYAPQSPDGSDINSFSAGLDAGGGGNSGGGMFDNMLGEDGWGSLALGGVKAGMGAYFGFKQLGAAKDQLNFQKESFNKNYDAQKRTTNAEMRDRQTNRNASQPGQHQKTAAYMKQNGIK